MRGFKEHGAADRFAGEHDNFAIAFRSRSRHNQHVSATRRRRRFLHLELRCASCRSHKPAKLNEPHHKWRET